MPSACVLHQWGSLAHPFATFGLPHFGALPTGLAYVAWSPLPLPYPCWVGSSSVYTILGEFTPSSGRPGLPRGTEPPMWWGHHQGPLPLRILPTHCFQHECLSPVFLSCAQLTWVFQIICFALAGLSQWRVTPALGLTTTGVTIYGARSPLVACSSLGKHQGHKPSLHPLLLFRGAEPLELATLGALPPTQISHGRHWAPSGRGLRPPLAGHRTGFPPTGWAD